VLTGHELTASPPSPGYKSGSKPRVHALVAIPLNRFGDLVGIRDCAAFNFGWEQRSFFFAASYRLLTFSFPLTPKTADGYHPSRL
jgi:hypothetical protein